MNRIQSLINNTKLRPALSTDFDLYLKVLNDPEVSRLIGIQTFGSDISIKKWFEYDLDNTSKLIMAIEYQDNTIGFVLLTDIDRFDRRACISIYILPEYIGKGIGQIACYKMLEIAFDRYNLNKVKSAYYAYNKLSGNTQKRTGFIYQGCEKDDIFFDGRYWDKMLLAIWREGFEKLKDKFNKYKRND